MKILEGSTLMIRKIWDTVLMLLALLFLFAFSYPAFVLDVSEGMQATLEIIQWISWFAFAIDLLVNILNANDKMM